MVRNSHLDSEASQSPPEMNGHILDSGRRHAEVSQLSPNSREAGEDYSRKEMGEDTKNHPNTSPEWPARMQPLFPDMDLIKVKEERASPRPSNGAVFPSNEQDDGHQPPKKSSAKSQKPPDLNGSHHDSGFDQSAEDPSPPGLPNPLYSSPLPSLASLARSPRTPTSFHHAGRDGVTNGDALGKSLRSGIPRTRSMESLESPRGPYGSETGEVEQGHGYGQPPGFDRSQLRQHVYHCHLCTFVGLTNQKFTKHMTTHFDQQCPYCDYTSRTEGRLKRHIKDFHDLASDDPDNPRNNKSKLLRCRQCEYTNDDKYEFWAHQRGHIKDEKMLQCPKCPFVTEYKHHLEYHLRNHFGSKPYRCTKCNYACVNKSMLNSHMKSHTNVYQYRCADCTYATKYCHSLKLHLKKYQHNPATVLNADGSLPTDGSGDFELMSKRGPPRGPRGPRKEKGAPSVAQTMSQSSPQITLGSSMFGTPPPFWPLMPTHPALGGIQPSPPIGFPGPPPLIPVPGMPPLGLSLPPSHGLFPCMNGTQKDLGQTSKYVQCHLCPFNTTSQLKLTAHLTKVHPSEHREFQRAYGAPLDKRPESHAGQHEVNTPQLPNNPVADMTRMWAMMASAAVAQGLVDNPQKEKTLNGQLENSYDNERAPSETTPSEDSIYHKHVVAANLMASIQAEAERTGECPLDLTKSGSSDEDNKIKNSLKRTHSESGVPDVPTVNGQQNETPRKRSRKGKAYKLNRLQSQSDSFSSHPRDDADEEDGSYENDSNLSTVEDTNAASSSTKSVSETTYGNDSKTDSRDGSQSTVDYEQLRQSLAELNGARQDHSVRSNDNSSADDTKAEVKPASERDTLIEADEKPVKSSWKLPAHLGLEWAKQGKELMRAGLAQNTSGQFECGHCDITFGDCVMYSMHMGYHGYDDPFTCNMCGHESGDKVDFFLHVSRVAHQ